MVPNCDFWVSYPLRLVVVSCMVRHESCAVHDMQRPFEFFSTSVEPCMLVDASFFAQCGEDSAFSRLLRRVAVFDTSRPARFHVGSERVDSHHCF